MSKPPRDHSQAQSSTYFAYRDQGKFHLHEFVIMPNHIHLLLSPVLSTTLERCMQLIKGGFSHRAGKELGHRNEIWQRGYVDHRVLDASDYAQHRAYIHQNPVRAKLSNTADDYPYSSAHAGFQLDPEPQRLKPTIQPLTRHD